MRGVQTLLVNKLEIVMDDMWLKYIQTHIIPFVEPEEVFKVATAMEVEVCDDCQTYYTSDGEVVMDCYGCPDQQEFCLNCCNCPNDHQGGGFWS